MTKLKFTLIAFLFFNTTYSQNIDGELNEEISFSISQEEAYTNSLIWIAENFNDSNSSIKMKDKDAGIIVVKGVNKSDEFSTSFTLTFRFKESICMVSIKDWRETEYSYIYGDSSNCYTKACRKNFEKWTIHVDQLASRLIKELDKEIKG